MPIESNTKDTRQHSTTSSSNAAKNSLSKRLTPIFGRAKDPVSSACWKSETISTVWGLNPKAGEWEVKWLNRLDRLQAYFNHLERLLGDLETLTTGYPNSARDLRGADLGCCSFPINNVPKPTTVENTARTQEIPSQRQQESEPKYNEHDHSGKVEERCKWPWHGQHYRLLKYVQLLRLTHGVPRNMLKSERLGLSSDQYTTGLSKRKELFPGCAATVGNRDDKLDEFVSERIPYQLTTETPLQSLQPISPPIWKEDSDATFGASLALATKAVFGISIHDRPYFRDGDAQIKQTNCIWTKEMTLEQLLDREFPKSIPNEQLSGRFKERLVSLRSLVEHADIEVVWTTHFPDHLLLSYNTHRKTLSLFDLPSLIEATYEASVSDDINNNNIEGAKDYCSHDIRNGSLGFSAEFMFETLQTYHLLIPRRDAKWVSKTFLQSDNPWYFLRLSKKKYSQAKDKRITEVFRLLNRAPGIDKRLTTYSQMFKRFPHWGLRIQSLLEEVEDPTPMSWTGRWAERRKGPRHSFWVTVVAFIAASVFGIVATAFAVVQLWVAWCDWQDGAPPLCKPRSSPGSGPTASMTADSNG